MLPKNEVFTSVKIGDTVKARVLNVREDGKLTLSLREKAHVQMDADADMIVTKLTAADGYLPYNDGSDPEKIKLEFKMSKNAFKRAIGKLYKAGTILITDDGIKLSK
ncbi:MAG: hypothetical protein K0R46_794 [Herbinix sp.]|jgi:predicted RNA-binding protein (virulence factor B family)|nr:hypothetical protein [Herbinix sp.]